MDRELRCPHCGRINDTHQRPETSADPEPGDIGICWKCHGLAMLTPFGFLRGPNDPEEAAEWEADSDVKRARAAMSESYTPSQALRLFRGES
jgi:hypothetical protein